MPSRRRVLGAPFRMMFYISTSVQKEIRTFYLNKKQKQNSTLGLLISIGMAYNTIRRGKF